MSVFRPKLDPRLALFLHLGAETFAPEGFDTLEREDGKASPPDMRRSGPLAFLRGYLPEREVTFAPAAGAAQRIPTGQAPLAIPAFVRVASADVIDRLTSLGAKVISRATSIVTAEVPLARIDAIEDDPGVVSIAWSGSFRPLTPESAPSRQSQGACSAIGLDPEATRARNGRGTIVGVVDVGGIDLYHPSFVDRCCRSSIACIWDQRVTPSPDDAIAEPGPGGLGTVHRRRAIDAEIAPQQPVKYAIVDHQALKGSHGTTTAALAAGLDTDRPDARGIAPGADIVFVNTFGSGPAALGTLTELADAIAFIFRYAGDTPCVVNVSLGDDLGPRDGTSPVETFIGELLDAPNRAVVVAAGNSHQKKKHITASLDAEGSATFVLNVPPNNPDRAIIEIWSRAGASGESLELTLVAPDGREFAVPQDGVGRAHDLGDTGLLAISVPRCPASTNAVARVEIVAKKRDGHLLDGRYGFRVRAKGAANEAHAWVDHAYVQWIDANDTLTVTTPATARGAIVVGAHDAQSDQAAWYSGRGVDRAGVRRPDLLAPTDVVAAHAQTTVRYVESASGTSVAAPIVAGAAAILAQMNGAPMSAGAMRAALTSLTRPTKDADVGRLWVSRWPEARRAEHPSSANMPVVTGRTMRDTAQIMVAEHLIFQENRYVGEVITFPGDDPLHTTEHWFLLPEYREPSGVLRDVSLRFRYAGPPIPIALASARQPAGTRYIRAECRIVPLFAPNQTGASRAKAAEEAAQRLQISSPQRAKSDVPRPGAPGSGPPEGEAESTQERREPSMNRNYTRTADATQIMVGTYELHQIDREIDILVGKLLVTEGNSPGESTENWLLYPEYRWPSQTHPDQSIRFVRLGPPISLAELLAHPPAGTTFVVAACSQQKLP